MARNDFFFSLKISPHPNVANKKRLLRSKLLFSMFQSAAFHSVPIVLRSDFPKGDHLSEHLHPSLPFIPLIPSLPQTLLILLPRDLRSSSPLLPSLPTSWAPHPGRFSCYLAQFECSSFDLLAPPITGKQGCSLFFFDPWVVHFDPELHSAPSALPYPVSPSHAACMRGRRKSCPCLASPSPSLTLPTLVVTPDSSAPMPPISQTISSIPAVILASFSRPAQDALSHLLDQVPSPPSLSTHPHSSSVPCGADSNRTAFQKVRGVLLIWWLFLFSLAWIRTKYSCRSVLCRS